MSDDIPPIPKLVMQEWEDLIALPGRFCLYDRSGRRVEGSRHYTFNRYIGPDPEVVDVDVPMRTIDEPVVYGGLIPKPHFGHFLTEAFTRLWPYDAGDLADVPHAHFLHWERELRPFESELMDTAMADIAGPFVRLDRPTLLRRVLLPSQAIVLEQPLPDQALLVYDRIRDRMVGDIRPSDRPVYLSRSRVIGGRRRTLGEEALERRLRRAGFDVVHPQELPLSEQVRIVAAARTVVGLFGSALHLTIFRAVDQARTIALNPRTGSRFQQEIEHARGNEYLGMRAEYPLHLRHPRIRRGRAVRLGRYRNLVLPRRTADRVLRRTARAVPEWPRKG